MMRISFYFVTLFLAMINVCIAKNTDNNAYNPILMDELFRSSVNYSYKLNPVSDVIARHYFRGEDYNVIELIDIKNNHVADAFRIKVKEYAYIKDFSWVDENTLFVSYRLGKDKHKEIFLEIDIEKFKREGGETSKIREIKENGSIINFLPNEKNLLLFQKKEADKFSVYWVTTEMLVSGNINGAKKFEKEKENAKLYLSDNKGEVRFVFTVSDDEIAYWYLSELTDTWIKLFSSDDKSDFEFTPIGILDNDKFAVITDKDTDTQALVEYDIRTKTFGKVLFQHPKYDLVDAEIFADTKKIKSVSYFDHGRYISQYFSKEDIKLENFFRKELPEKQYFVVSEKFNSSVKVLYVFSSDDPGMYYWADSESKKIVKLHPSFPQLNKYKFSKTESFSVVNEDGMEIEAILTKPEKTQANGVLLVSPHGGPVGVRNLDVFNASNQYYASRGYTILNVNFRGSTGYGKKFLSGGKGQFGKKIEEDITLAVTEVNKKYKFNKTCSMGASYGGYSALVLAAYHPDTYDCSVASYGIYDLPLLFNASNIHTLKEYRAEIEKVVGEFDESLEKYSPFYFAEKINKPTLLIAGYEDEISGFEQSNRMKYRLKQLNKDVETMFYSKTGHGHKTWYWEKHEHAIIDQFLRRKLNLPELVGSNISEVRGKEAMLIADAYNFDDLVKDDSQKAFDMYQLAASHKIPRALFNLGSFYHSAKVVDKNIPKAIELYKEASKLGYSSASYRLARLYRTGKNVIRDYAESNQYYKIAQEQGESKAELAYRHSICAGWGIERDLQACFKGSLEEDDKYFDNFWELLQTVASSENLSSNEVTYLREVIHKKGYSELVSGKDIDVEDYGLYEKNIYGKFENEQEDVDLNIKQGQYIGVQFEISEDSFTEDSRIIYKIVWSHPDIKNEGELIENVKTERLNYTLPDKMNRVSYYFKYKSDLAVGKWKLELLNLENKVLYSKTFNIIKASEK